MVGVDLGTRLVKVNVSKIGKDHTAVEDVDVPLDRAALASQGGKQQAKKTDPSPHPQGGGAEGLWGPRDAEPYAPVYANIYIYTYMMRVENLMRPKAGAS
jgi:hypothetical protein